jgi:putative CocE/NonD family hydrolase
VVQMSGAFDQAPVEIRDDVMVYTGARLERDLVVAGRVTASIVFATTGRSADVTVKLVDVHPDGRALNVVDSVARSNFKPGSPKLVSVDVGSIGIVFKAGHRVRVQISSSNFPRLDRNPSTDTPANEATSLEGASQVVHLGGPNPSFITLPVLAH